MRGRLLMRLSLQNLRLAQLVDKCLFFMNLPFVLFQKVIETRIYLNYEVNSGSDYRGRVKRVMGRCHLRTRM